MAYLTVLLFAIFAPFTQTSQIQEFLTPNEDSNIFRTSYDSVTKYEIVPIKHMRHKRNADERILEMSVFGENITLHLKPTDEVLVQRSTPVWTINKNQENPEDMKLNLVENAMDGIENFYVDEENEASISAKTDEEGFTLFNGVVGIDIVIRPASIQHRRQRRGLHNNKLNLSITDHIVYKRSDNSDFNSHSSSPEWVPHYHEWQSLTMRESELPTPEVVYPQILVIMDDQLYSKFGKNIKRALSYIVTFWNGVDIRYRELEKPRVHLNIAGIILAEDRPTFLTSSMFRTNGTFTGRLIADKVLDDIGMFLYKDLDLAFKDDYDLALFMTGYDLVRENDNYSEKIGLRGLLGLAATGAACFINYSRQMVSAVGAVEDTGGFIGILHTVHELAHLLGAQHDGDDPDLFLGGPGAADCASLHNGDGHIMSDDKRSKKRVRFSKCSKAAMRYFFKREKAECLYNVPTFYQNETIPKILPGKILSLNEQCRRAGYMSASFFNENVCTQLRCERMISQVLRDSINYGPAAEGSPCGDGSHCINAECVRERTEIDPITKPSAGGRKNKTLNEICKSKGAEKAVDNGGNICGNLICTQKILFNQTDENSIGPRWNVSSVDYGPVEDGTICDNNDSICSKGLCVPTRRLKFPESAIRSPSHPKQEI